MLGVESLLLVDLRDQALAAAVPGLELIQDAPHLLGELAPCLSTSSSALLATSFGAHCALQLALLHVLSCEVLGIGLSEGLVVEVQPLVLLVVFAGLPLGGQTAQQQGVLSHDQVLLVTRSGCYSASFLLLLLLLTLQLGFVGFGVNALRLLIVVLLLLLLLLLLLIRVLLLLEDLVDEHLLLEVKHLVQRGAV